MLSTNHVEFKNSPHQTSDNEPSPDIISQISEKDIDAAKETIKKHGEIKDNEFFRGLLVKAMRANELATVYVLCKGGINFKKGFTKTDSNTNETKKVEAPTDIELWPLVFATRYNHPQVALLLLQLGCIPTSKNLQQAIYYPPKIATIKYKNLLIKEIRKKVQLKDIWHQRVLDNHITAMQYISVDNLKMKDSIGLNPLHYACILGRLDIIKALANVNLLDVVLEEKSDSGDSPLSCAIENNHLSVVKYLIGNCFANVLVKSYAGNTPLHLALTVEMIEYLKSYGACLNNKNNQGQTPFMSLSLLTKFQDKNYLNALITNLDASKNILALNQGKTSTLAREVSSGSLENIQYLLAHEVDVDYQDENEETPLFRAKSIDVAKLLVEHKADIEHQNKYGVTPLGNATHNSPLFHWFIEQGAGLSSIHNALKYHAIESPSCTSVNLLLNLLGPYLKITNEIIKSVIANLEKPNMNLEEVSAICVLFILYSPAEQVKFAKSELANQSAFDILRLFPVNHALIQGLFEEGNSVKRADRHFTEALATDNDDKKQFVHLILGHIHKKRANKHKKNIDSKLILIAAEHFSNAKIYAGNSHLLKLARELGEKLSSIEGLESKDQELLNKLRISADAGFRKIELDQKLKELIAKFSKESRSQPENKVQLEELFLLQSGLIINELKELKNIPLLTPEKRLKFKELCRLQQEKITEKMNPLILLLQTTLDFFEPKSEFDSWREHYDFAELLHENFRANDSEKGLKVAIYHAEQAIKKAYHEDNIGKAMALKNGLSRCLSSLVHGGLPSLTHSIFLEAKVEDSRFVSGSLDDEEHVREWGNVRG